MPLVIGSLLAALIVVPVWLRQRTEHLRDRVTDVALPARNALLEVQNAFATELAAIRGFELTGDRLFLDDFRAGLAKDRQATERLLQLAPQLGPEAATAIAELDARKEAWLEEPREAADGKRSREQLIRSLSEGERRVNGVLIAADKANAAVIRAEAALRQRVANDERSTAGFVLFLALLALVVVVAVGWLVRRLNLLAAELRRGVEEESSLHHLAGSLNGAASVEEVGRQVTRAAVERTQSSSSWLERVVDGAPVVVASNGDIRDGGVTLRIPATTEHGVFGDLVLVGATGVTGFSPSDLSYAASLGVLATAALSRVLLIEREQTARREAEEAVRYRDQMLRVVSHDLKNPLHTIGMVAEFLEAGNHSDAERVKQIRIVTRTVLRMNRLIHDLLDAARVQSGSVLPIVRTKLVTRTLLSDIAEIVGPQAHRKHITLTWNADSAPDHLEADRDRLVQVFLNLTGNAIKFTPEGGRIDVSARRDGDCVRFAIADTGTGIAEEDMPHLFEPFWQAKDRATLGTGLGLSIARGIVEAHGGKIEVMSKPGEGTVFSFTLPA